MTLKEFGGILASLTGISQADAISALSQADKPEEYKDLAEVTKFLNETIGNRFKVIGEDNLKRGKKEALSALERDIRQSYGLDNKAQGLELVSALLEAQKSTWTKENSGQGAGKTTEITEDMFKNSDFAKNLVDTWSKKYSDLETEFTTFKNDAQSKEHKTKVLDAVTKWFTDQGTPVLGKTKGELQRKAFFDSINPNEWGFDESGNLIPVDAEHNQLKHPVHYTPITASERLNQACFIEFHEIDPGKKGADLGKSGGSLNPLKVNPSDINSVLNNPNISYEDKQKAYEAYQKAQK